MDEPKRLKPWTSQRLVGLAVAVALIAIVLWGPTIGPLLHPILRYAIIIIVILGMAYTLKNVGPWRNRA